MPPLYPESQSEAEDEFIGLKINEWREGDSQAALDLADFYQRNNQPNAALLFEGLAHATDQQGRALTAGLALKEVDPARALQCFREAFFDLQDCLDEIHALFQKHDAVTLGLTEESYGVSSMYIADLIAERHKQELPTIMLPGTRPVLFQKEPGPPTVDNVQWGGGSLFVVKWQGMDFAVTALHTIENIEADRKEFRLLMPGSDVTFEMFGGISPSSAARSERDELDDVYAWHIKGHPNPDLGWWSWDLEQWSKPGSQVSVGQQLFAAGYPDVEGRYDWENFRVNPIASIVSGTLSSDVVCDGVYAADIPDIDHDMDMMSGGPVFAKFEDRYYYVGMILRGTQASKKLYFLDSIYVIGLLEKHNHSADVP